MSRGPENAGGTRGGVTAKLVKLVPLALSLQFGSTAAMAELKLQSSTVTDGARLQRAQLHYGSGCSGENISPQLQWDGASVSARSFALILEDLDASDGDRRWHWVVFNIPESARELPEGAGDPKAGLIPEAIQSNTDFGSPGYSGACPPRGQGDHRYQFRLYALSVEQLPLDAGSPVEQVIAEIQAHKLAEAQLEVTYGR